MKRFLCVVLTLALALSALAGCEKKFDPQKPDAQASEPESSQAAPEPSAPEPIMPVPDLDAGGEEEDDPEPDAEDEEEPADEDEEEADQEAADANANVEDADESEEPADGEDADAEEGDEEDEDDEDSEGLDELGIPAVPHGDELSWLDFTTVTADQLRPVLNKVLARAEYFCQYGMTKSFTAAGPDPRKEVSITRPYRTYGNRTYYPYTNLPYHTLDELEEGLMTVFTWNVVTADMYYLFEIMADDGDRLYYVDEVAGLNKARGWDTGDLVIREADSSKLVVRMTTSWQGDTFTSDLTLRKRGGYLVMEADYFAISEEQQAALHHSL